MKKAHSLKLLAATTALATCFSFFSSAQNADNTIPPASAAPAVAQKLPYGVEDIVKLSHAQISEDVILNYVQNSGTVYNLGPNDLVYLRQQGVSDRVVNAMLDQRRHLSDPAAPQTQVAVTAPPSAPSQDAQAQAQQPAEAPLQPPASSVYVIPNSGAQYAYYGSSYPYYPYYYPYYYGPSISLGFGYYGGHYYHGGHYYGGHYGGGGHWGGSGHWGGGGSHHH